MQVLFRELYGKEHPDQIIKVSYDDVVEDLLQENNLTLTTAIAKCRSKEAAKKHRSDTAGQESEVVATLRHSYQPARQTFAICPGCGVAIHKGGCCQCPAYNQTSARCHKVGHFAKVCWRKQAQSPTSNLEHQPNA